MGRFQQWLGVILALSIPVMAVAETAGTLRLLRVPYQSLTLPVAPPAPGALPAVQVRQIPKSSFPVLEEGPQLSAFGLPCGMAASVDLLETQTYRVTLHDPCQSGKRLVLGLSGLRFSDRFSVTGKLKIDIPAFAEEDRLSIQFEEGEGFDIALPRSDLRHVARVGLSWTGLDAPTLAAQRNGGITMLGQGDQTLQILTQFVTPDTPKVTRLRLLQTVDQTSCTVPGRGRVVQMVGGDALQSYQISLSKKNCDQIGQTLELKNVLEDLKLAPN